MKEKNLIYKWKKNYKNYAMDQIFFFLYLLSWALLLLFHFTAIYSLCPAISYFLVEAKADKGAVAYLARKR